VASEGSGLAATSRFAVRDRAAAEALADALAEFGFAEVGARPATRPALLAAGMGWQVDLVDRGPYPGSVLGHRQLDAAGWQARAIARAHGGFWCGGGIHPDGSTLSLQRSSPPVLRLNPVSRPLVPPVAVAPAPPAGGLSLAPDVSAGRAARPQSLDAVGWAMLEDAYGPAQALPALLAALADAPAEWDERLGDLVNRLLHQGSCYSASGPAVAVLAQMITGESLPAARRRDVYCTLIWAAGLYRDDLIADADQAAALGRSPRPGPFTEQVHDAIGAAMPRLLARWGAEPSANQLALAVLAAIFPAAGQAIRGAVAQLAAALAGTQAGCYARCAHQLITGDAAAGLATAADIAAWNDNIPPCDLDNELIRQEYRAVQVLAEAAASAIAVIGRP
jgi:hypothetical protein